MSNVFENSVYRDGKVSATQNEQIHSDLHKIGGWVQFCHQNTPLNTPKNNLNFFSKKIVGHFFFLSP
jgi:hypothetical protein